MSYTVPEVGDIFAGPSLGRTNRSRPGKYTVAAIVDLGFFSNDPTYHQVVFRFWSPHKSRYCWEIVGADAIDVGLYKLVKKTRSKKKPCPCA
jgi:hypothetical protein